VSETVVLPSAMRERLLATIARRHPRKSFGYLISDRDAWHPTDFLIFSSNERNSDGWRQEFESYGRYFVDHSDAGFVADPVESWYIQKQIWQRGMFEVGVFHSHQRHPANFSRIDYELHLARFSSVWHLIISMRNPRLPQLRAYLVSRDRVRELSLMVEDVTSRV
jgi:proteasome lid subunit RPN8/RPN11